MRNDFNTLNKLILFTAEAYMSNALKEGLTHDPFHQKIVNGINNYSILCKFDKEQHSKVVAFGETEIGKKLRESEFSHIIFSLQLLQMWIDRVPREQRRHIALGVSNKKLLMGRASFALDMIKLKQRDEEKYAETRQIIDEAVLMGRHFFDNAFAHFIDG
jgi:hypothetical protein